MPSFYWNGHSNYAMKNFANLYEKKLFVDCSLNVEGQSIEAHKNILSAFSPFFEHVFTELPHKRNFVLEDVKFRDVKSALDLIYHGRTEISQSRMQSFLDLVEILELPDEALKLSGDKNRKEGSGQEPGPGTSDVDRYCLKLSKDGTIVGCELDLPGINTDNSDDRSLVETESLSSLVTQFTKRGVYKAKSSHDDRLTKKRGLCLEDILRRSSEDLEINSSSSISKLKRNSDPVMDLGQLLSILNDSSQKETITTSNLKDIQENEDEDDEILLEDLESCESDDDDNAGEPPSKKNKNSSKQNYNKPDSLNGERFEPRDVASMKSTFPKILDLLEDFKNENRNLAQQIIQNQCVIVHILSDKKHLGFTIDEKKYMKSYNLKFPLETLEEFQRFSKLLEDDPIFQENLSIMLTSSLDKNHVISKSIVNMLKTLMKKDLANSFCISKHIENKLIMTETPLYHIMLGLVTSKRSISKMETHVKDFKRYLSGVLANVSKWKD